MFHYNKHGYNLTHGLTQAIPFGDEWENEIVVASRHPLPREFHKEDET
jgi:hypothetical protein